MEPKVVNRKVKTITTLKYGDGSTKTIEDFNAYEKGIKLPIFSCGSTTYKDENGIIDEDRSNSYHETLCSLGNSDSENEIYESEFSESEEGESDPKDLTLTKCRFNEFNLKRIVNDTKKLLPNSETIISIELINYYSNWVNILESLITTLRDVLVHNKPKGENEL